MRLSYREALNQAMREEMRRDARVFLHRGRPVHHAAFPRAWLD